MHGARKEGLSRRHRFAVQGSFGPVLRSPQKVRGTLATVHVAQGRPGISRLGIALTRRLVPSSVQRNRVKRIARELFRRHPVKLAGLDVVISLREKLTAEGREKLGTDVRTLLDEALRKASAG
ncbi:ribonuclease P protein component [Betaproteobacteria bacterium GR16-43]|nr:ribonuclease P protein component [Betaproteobacteria bacterium GR16-43]